MVLARWQSSIHDSGGVVFPGASVEVRREIPGAPLAQLFSDRDGTIPLANPFTADNEGYAFFHVVGGAYKITATSGAFSRTWRYVAIGTAQELDIVVVGPGGITFPILFSTSTADADPGSGTMRLNQATQNTATLAYIDLSDADLADITGVLDSLDDVGSFQHRGQFRLTKYDNPAQWLAFNITGLVTSAAGYRKLTIAIISQSTASPFANSDRLIFSFAPAGPAGQGGLKYTFNTATSGDPGSGKFLFNNAAFASATQLNISETDGNGNALASLLTKLDDSSAINKCLVIATKQDGSAYFSFFITAALTDVGTYDTYPITPIQTSGATANNDVFNLLFVPVGDRGDAGLKYSFNTATSGDPGSGKFLFNNAAFGSATQLNISETDGNGNALASLLTKFDDSSSANKCLVIAAKQDGSAYFSFYITAALTDNGAYDSYPITPIQTSGSIANNDPFNVLFVPIGDKGDVGAGLASITRLTKTANYTVVLGDLGKLIDATSGTWTLSLTAAATLGNGFFAFFRNSGPGNVTISPASGTIDGVASFISYPGEARLIQCDGSNFFSVVLQAFNIEFAASGNFTVPPGYAGFMSDAVAGGAGGGGARGGAAGSNRNGGGGGGGGERLRGGPYLSSLFTVGATVAITVGAGGAKGTGGANADGTNGANGGNSSFGAFLTAHGGVQGLLGTSALSGAGGNGGSSTNPPTATDGFGQGKGEGGTGSGVAGRSAEWGGGGGGAASVTIVAAAGGNALFGAPGGGGGGGVSSGNSAANGGAAGTSGGGTGSGGGAAAGTGGAVQSNGTGGAVGTNAACGGSGGGGGGNTAGTGGNGGNGATPGGAGGGGGGGTTTGGNGGDGAAGAVRIWGV